MNLIPAILGALLIFFGTLLTSCSGGGGAEVTVNQTQSNNQNQNQDSQNGETVCSHTCSPSTFNGQVGFYVTTNCEGVFNGPEFVSAAPADCVLEALPEGE